MLDFGKPHRRRNPLTGEWVLVSPQRTRRPWQGEVAGEGKETPPDFDPKCFLCPGNTRAGGNVNPKYEKTFAFTNDFQAILPEAGIEQYSPNDIIEATQEEGLCRVICYSPHHGKTMADMDIPEITEIIKTWITEYQTIGADKNISYVQIFENKGALMGASSPHPHCQIWATHHLPSVVESEQTNQKEYLVHHHAPLLVDYLKHEYDERKRMIGENDAFSLLIPFWAIWPYETMILPSTHKQSLTELTTGEIEELAQLLSRLTKLYDKVFNASFPYSMGIHQAPTDEKEHDEWQMHFHFYPPLLRSATIKKFLVGYEMLAEPQRDITPEEAAATLRKLYETL